MQKKNVRQGNVTKGNAAENLEWLISDVNEAQREAVVQTEGPVLILAGAGSGKTRVLTYRIAYVLANGLASPGEILAMTFTNKAAGEMRDRVAKLVPDLVSGMWIGTFHSLFARLLRREGERIGYPSNFAIYDDSDQTTLIKAILKEMNLDAQANSPRLISHKISNAKNKMLPPRELLETAETPDDVLAAQVYTLYQNRLREQNAMDFDDLLLKPLELFDSFPSVLQYYQDRFRYILVDEYQDTNHAQYLAVRILAQKHKNICVVGDDDQSIYRWRGADLRNILDFEHDYPRCSKFRLEQNYRSTKNILAAAHSVVKNNRQRHSKELWTKRQEGDRVMAYAVSDEKEEARYIVNCINNEFRIANRNFYDFALLYRTNAQSRALEDALRVEGIPYVIVGGVRFYERKEVKDVLAYLRVLSNPSDTVNLKRIINYPVRGIGDATIAKLDAFARDQKLTLFNVLSRAKEVSSIAPRTADKVISLHNLLEKYISLQKEFLPAELATMLVEELGIFRLFKEEGTIEAASRADNVRELLLAIAEFNNANGRTTTLADYLQQVTLVSDIDTWNDKSNMVTLMTLHSAKGLEFSVVFITGMEEGLFPLSRSLDDPSALEEERRLFYVGATRAKEKLYLTWARNRRRFGELPGGVKSRFLKELGAEYVQFNESRTQQLFKKKRERTIWTQDPMPNYEDESQEQIEFKVGMRVYHNKFGKGTILKINAQTGNIKLAVLFDEEGEKRLVLPYAKLEIL